LGRLAQHGKTHAGGLWVGALVAGTLGGLGDGLAAIRQSSLAHDSMRDLILVAVSLFGGLGVSLLAAAVAWLLAPRMGWPRDRWAGFSVAAVAWAALWVGSELPGAWSLLALLGFGAVPTLMHKAVGRSRMVASLVFLAMLAVVVAGDRRPRTDGPLPETAGPDVVLVVIDGLRADQVDRNPTGDLPAMPQLQALAATGTRFTRALAPATTATAAQAAVVLGRPPWTPPTGAEWPRELSARGVETAFFGGPEVAAVAVSAGFTIRDVDGGWPPGLRGGTPGRVWSRLTSDEGGRRSARRVVAAWTSWLEAVPEARPTVSVVHLSDLSWPTHPSPPWDTAFEVPPPAGEVPLSGPCAEAASRERLSSPRRIRSAYDGAAAAVDAVLPDILATAQARPRGAVVAVVGSRGTPVGENDLWLDASGDVHPAAARVPLVVTGPEIPVGSVLAAPVSTADLVATLRAWHELAAVSDARPLPGLVRGHRPRDTAWTVGVDASVGALTTEAHWLRWPDGQLFRYEDGEWRETEDTPSVPVPLLTSVAREPSPCR